MSSWNIACTNCGATYTLTFENKTAHIGEYALAIDKILSEPCPECGRTKLVEYEPDDIKDEIRADQAAMQPRKDGDE